MVGDKVWIIALLKGEGDLPSFIEAAVDQFGSAAVKQRHGIAPSEQASIDYAVESV